MWVGVLLVYMSLTGPPLHPSVSLNTSCRDWYKGSATAFLRNMFSSLAVERGPKRCGHIKRSRTPSKGPPTCTTERLGLRWCQGAPGIPWTFWQPGPASAQSTEPAYRQLGLRGVFRDPAGPQHGEGDRTADGREGGYRGPRHPKILSMMTAGARDENAPGAVGAERSRRACPKNPVLRLLQNLLQGSGAVTSRRLRSWTLFWSESRSATEGSMPTSPCSVRRPARRRGRPSVRSDPAKRSGRSTVYRWPLRTSSTTRSASGTPTG